MRCLDDETAALVFADSLSDEVRAEIDAHVDGCDECFALLAALAETLTPVSAPEPEADEPEEVVRTWRRGSRVGRYVLLEQVGSGGMGTVFAAEDPALGRTIAIKLVRTTLRSEKWNQNLVAEARMMAQLSHPNVVPVFDVGTEQDFVFLAMELIDGSNLREWLGKTTRSAEEVRRVLYEAGKGLVAAHRAGLVHRDFKPDNVLVGKDGRVVVTDFGLAHSTLSPSDRVAGTLMYMAPEQREGQVADAMSDQFSFAVTLSEALTGERNATTTRMPRWLARIVMRGTSTRPAERFPSMDALLDALARNPQRTWRKRIAIAAGILAVVTTAGLSWSAARATHACADAVPAKLAGTWDHERSEAVHRAFATTGSASADPAWKSVEATLDKYATEWAAMNVETCDATFARKEQSAQLFDLRVACLNDRLAELRAATTLFAAADGRVVANAPNAARALTAIASCGDSRALLAIKPPPPALAARVGDLRRDLARAKAMRDGGKLPDAITVASSVAEGAEATGYQPLEATALLQLGDVELANGDGEHADTTLGRAALVADAARDDVTRVRALTRQMYAAGFVLEQFARVPTFDAQIVSIIARLGGDDELDGDRLQSLGMISLAERDLPSAVKQLTRATALREKKFGPRGRRVAMSLHSRCVVRFEEQNFDGALGDCERALDIWTDALGPDHPDVSLALKNIGRIELKLGHIDKGCHSIQRALDIEEAILAADHPTIATTLLYLADCRAARDDDAGALLSDLRALAIRETKLGPRHPRTAEALTQTAGRYTALHDEASAKAFLDRAHAILPAKP